jgi:hypothetical protein
MGWSLGPVARNRRRLGSLAQMVRGEQNQYYLSKWLPKAWNISVNSDVIGAA